MSFLKLLIDGTEATGLSVVSFAGIAPKSLPLASIVGIVGVVGGVGGVGGGWTLCCGLPGFAIFLNPLNGLGWFKNRVYSLGY